MSAGDFCLRRDGKIRMCNGKVFAFPKACDSVSCKSTFTQSLSFDGIGNRYPKPSEDVVTTSGKYYSFDSGGVSVVKTECTPAFGVTGPFSRLDSHGTNGTVSEISVLGMPIAKRARMIHHGAEYYGDDDDGRIGDYISIPTLIKVKFSVSTAFTADVGGVGLKSDTASCSGEKIVELDPEYRVVNNVSTAMTTDWFSIDSIRSPLTHPDVHSEIPTMLVEVRFSYPF